MFCQSKIFNNYIKRLEEKIKEWQEERILLYGAGEHSLAILERICWEKVKFLGFVNRQERRKVDQLRGYPVITPDLISGSGATKIVISSFSFQEDIYRDLIKMEIPEVEIIKLYTTKDLVVSLKNNYAFCPDNNKNNRPGLLKDRAKYIVPDEEERSPRILLIQPPFPIGNHRHKKILPINLLYLASYALRENPNAMIRVLDGQVHDLSINEMKALISNDSWDIIGFGYWTAQAPIVFELSKFIKENTKSFLIHGGVHSTLCPEESALHCDLMVMNEGEETFSKIVNLYPDKDKIFKIDGIAFQGEKGLTVNAPNPAIENLDIVPLPAFQLIPDITVYNSPMHVTGGLRTPLIGSRGCPYTCTFCSSPLIWEKKVRWRSAVNVVDEMEEVIRSYDIEQFHFWDDNIMLNRRYIEEICSEIKKRNLKINWCGLTRASHIIKFKDILPLMKEAGCVGIEIGIESFSDKSTDLVRKGEGVHDMIEASRYMEEAGIAPLYTHMLFNPGENINGYREKQKFLNEINQKNTAYLADSRLGQASTPHRKTEFEVEAKEQGEIYLEDYSTYVHHRINFIPYSLLDDVPVKNSKVPHDPLEFLEIILHAIFNWDENAIDQYLDVNQILWKKIDGTKTIRMLSDEIGSELSLKHYWKRVFVSLSIVGFAREGSIKSLN